MYSGLKIHIFYLSPMTLKPIRTLLIPCLFMLAFGTVGQTIEGNKMDQLDFMIGEWIGTSTVYEDGAISKKGSAYQKISYDLNRSIIVIELSSEFLQLHTIIRYDEQDETYYYYPFSERGTNRYRAEYEDEKLTVWSSESNRFIFSKPSEITFREYGERLVDGQWVKYFEDNFQIVPD